MVVLTVCLVSDFFCPNTGGVESHIYYLGQCLVQRGHKVVVVTHAYSDRRGIRYLTNGLKVYYLPFLVFYNGCALPTVFASLPSLRYVFCREKVDIVHGHSSFSALAHEAMFHAQALDIRTVFTDHSLFGFADATSILTNKLLQFSLCNCDHVVCVSHTRQYEELFFSKENTVLRARLPPHRVSVIPNAIYCEMFEPATSKPQNNEVTIVTIGRLVYRRGTDLLAAVIPLMCHKYPQVRFLIGGDGPKRIVLEETRERHQLQERVTLLGTLPHTQVREAMIKGQIYLNCSLTEAFCITIVEAACCGLHVVSTQVGGVPEVLPSDINTLTEPTVKNIFEALCGAVEKYQSGILVDDPWRNHERIRNMYYWPDVAQRTEKVYFDVLKLTRLPLSTKLKKYFRCGFVFGLFFILLASINHVFLWTIDYLSPRKTIPLAQDVPNNIDGDQFDDYRYRQSTKNRAFMSK